MRWVFHYNCTFDVRSADGIVITEYPPTPPDFLRNIRCYLAYWSDSASLTVPFATSVIGAHTIAERIREGE